ncbi:hypothetical protein JX266_012543 [Neoarthrinium moseri]|nr:hypothetical protein JX266_012543 [Neoarthrinium moseri]
MRTNDSTSRSRTEKPIRAWNMVGEGPGPLRMMYGPFHHDLARRPRSWLCAEKTSSDQAKHYIALPARVKQRKEKQSLFCSPGQHGNPVYGLPNPQSRTPPPFYKRLAISFGRESSWGYSEAARCPTVATKTKPSSTSSLASSCLQEFRRRLAIKAIRSAALASMDKKYRPLRPASLPTRTEAESSKAPDPAKGRHRSPKGPACNLCRARKIACDGVSPACANCVRRKVSCVYRQSRPPGLEGQLDILEARLDDHNSFLRYIASMPDNQALELLRSLRTNSDITNALESARGKMAGHRQISEHLIRRSVMAPTPSGLEHELTVLHHTAYPSLEPLKPDTLSAILNLSAYNQSSQSSHDTSHNTRQGTNDHIDIFPYQAIGGSESSVASL